MARQKWEYQVIVQAMIPGSSTVAATAADIQRALDRFGAEGWELVAASPLGDHLILVLKRAA